MSVETAIKKFIGEPFIWVCLAMVGVVLMGPAAANVARKVVGGDRNRGDVDQHGQTMVARPELQQSSGQRNGDESAAEPKQQNVFLATQNQGGRKPWRFDGLKDVNKDEITADDIREEFARRQKQSAAEMREPDEPASDAAENRNDVPVDAKEMVDEVRRESQRKSATSNDIVDGSGKGKLSSSTDDDTDMLADTKPDPEPKENQSSSGIVAQPDDRDDRSFEPLPDSNDQIALPNERKPQRMESSGGGKDENEKPAARSTDATADNQQDKLDPAVELDEFSPWDEPLKFDPESDLQHKKPQRVDRPDRAEETGSMVSVPPESGGAWWDASIAQQFWPGRQAQFASIDSVVFVALKNSAQIQILNDHPQIEETFVQQREADFDWSAFLDASWNSIDEPIRSELQTGARSGRFVQEELFVGSGLQKRLDHGGQLRVGSTIGTVDNNSIFLAPPDQGTATFSLDYRQPLLRGRGREVAQSQIVLARLNVETSRHAVKHQMQQYLVEVVTAYWDLYRARGVLAQRHRNLMRATEIVNLVSRMSGSRGKTIQLQRASAVAGARQSEVIDAEYVVADAQERLMNLTHGDHVANSNHVEIIPTDAPPQFSLPHDLGSVTESAIRNRAEVKEVLAEIKAASVRKMVALDGLKPQLDAIISSYVAGVRGDKDVGNAIYDQFSAGDPSYSVGMSFEIPIGRRSASASMKRQEIHERLLQNKLRKTLGDVSSSARSAFRDVYRLMAIIDNNRHVAMQSADALNTINKQLEWLSQEDPSVALYLNDLLNSQDQLAQAEQNLLDSQARLAIAYVALKRTTGELLQDSCGAETDCQACGVADCGCETVSHASWQQPVEHVHSILEGAEEKLDGFRDRFRGASPDSATEETQDIPLQRLDPRPGVTPMPEGSETAGEIFDAPSYPLSTGRSKDRPYMRY
jgi:outer membrane protein TolC